MRTRTFLTAFGALAVGLLHADVTVVVSPTGEILSPAKAVSKVRALRAAGALAADEQAVIRLS